MTGWSCECGATGLQGPQCAECGRRAWFLPPEEPPAPSRRGLDPYGVVVALVLVLVLVSGLLTAVHRGGARHRRLLTALRELSRYVEEVTGKKFRHGVDALLLDDAAFDRAYLGGETSDDEAPVGADYGATLRALGLTETGEDPWNAPATALGVLGFYDIGRDVLYVRGTDVTPFVKTTLVHELTHAWQDQHYDMSRLHQGTGSVDEGIARLALVEGDATRVEQRWRAEQSAADRAEIDRAERAAPSPPVRTRGERTLAMLSAFPYVGGATFATALAERGALLSAYGDLPASTEQVLHPDAYVRGDNPAQVPAPAFGGAAVDSGRLGELALVLLADDPRPARGWAGDAYVTYDDGIRLCTEATVVMDDAAARDRLLAALRRPGATVGRAGPAGLTLKACVPRR